MFFNPYNRFLFPLPFKVLLKRLYKFISHWVIVFVVSFKCLLMVIIVLPYVNIIIMNSFIRQKRYLMLISVFNTNVSREMLEILLLLLV